MSFEVRCISMSSDVSDAVRQFDDVFGPVLARTVEANMRFSGFGSLVIFTSIVHPVAQEGPDNRRGSYYKDTDTYFTSGRLDYADWITLDWEARTRGYAQSVREAIGRIAKTRITNDERIKLLSLVDLAEAEVLTSPPETIIALKPITLTYTEDTERPMISFGEPHSIKDSTSLGIRLVVVNPEDAFSVAASLATTHTDTPGGFKLYKRGDKRLRYHETWADNGKVTEHWGLCGGRGLTQDYSYRDNVEASRIILRLKTKAKMDGFSPIAISAHKKLIVEYMVESDFANPDELDKRHALEDHLNNYIGWLGLGHCDGGSSGQGTMEVCCFVVDYELAKTCIEDGLAKTKFADFNRIYLEK